jgi:hypothetical protein
MGSREVVGDALRKVLTRNTNNGVADHKADCGTKFHGKSGLSIEDFLGRGNNFRARDEESVGDALRKVLTRNTNGVG